MQAMVVVCCIDVEMPVYLIVDVCVSRFGLERACDIVVLTLDVLSWAVLLRADTYVRDSRGGDYFGGFSSCFAVSIGECRSPGSAFKD